MFEPWELGLIDEAGYNGIREEHLGKVAKSLRSTGLSDIDRYTFERHCRSAGIDPDNFDQDDLDALEYLLNE